MRLAIIGNKNPNWQGGRMVNCPVCQTKSWKKPSELKRNERFCSRRCTARGRKSDLTKITGANHWNWKGGITPINKKIRMSLEYEDWRKSVFERDNYTCQGCGEVGGYLEADHIKPFSLYPELRFELSNGRTLCRPCHLKIGWKGSHLQNL